MQAAPAAKPVLDAVEQLREMNSGNARKLPNGAPLNFIRERWAKLIFTETGVDRQVFTNLIGNAFDATVMVA